MLDVGTGSGAVALALKHERPDLQVSGSDLSESSLELARANGRRLGLEVRWLHADLLAEIPDEFDAVLSNLPYVAESERASLAPEILRHEPPEALFAGPDGLGAIRALLALLHERRRVSARGARGGRGPRDAGRGSDRAGGLLRCALASATWPGSSGSSWASATDDRGRRGGAPATVSQPAAGWRCSRPTPSMGWAAIRTTSRPSGGCMS